MMPPRKKGRRGKRNASEHLDDEAKENNLAEMSEDAFSLNNSSPCPINKKVKMETNAELPASKLKPDYWHCSELCHARLETEMSEDAVSLDPSPLGPIHKKMKTEAELPASKLKPDYWQSSAQLKAEMPEEAVSLDPSSPIPIIKKAKMETEAELPASKLKPDCWHSSALCHARLVTEMSADAVSLDPSPSGPINKKVKMITEDELPASELKSDYWHSSVLSHARYPIDQRATPVKDIPLKNENTSDIVLSNAVITFQDSGIGCSSVTMPKSESANEATADSGPSEAVSLQDISPPLSKVQAVFEKPIFVGKSEIVAMNEVISDSGSSPHSLSEIMCPLSAIEAKNTALKLEENETSSVSPSCAPAQPPVVSLPFCEEPVASTPNLMPKGKETSASPVSTNCHVVLPEVSWEMQDASMVSSSATSRVLQQVAESLANDIEVVEISKKEFALIDLTDDIVSPASTLPPSPVANDIAEVPENDSSSFPTTFLPFLKDIFNINIETISEIEKLFSNFEVSPSLEDKKDVETTDDESVIMCNPPSNDEMGLKQVDSIENDDDITILGIPASGKLAEKLSKSRKDEKLPVLSNILDGASSQNILTSTRMDLEGFGSASQILLETSSKTESGVLPTAPPIQKLLSAVVPAISENVPSQSVVLSPTLLIQELFSIAKPAISENVESQSDVLSTIQELFKTVVPAVSETSPSQNTESNVPLRFRTPPKQLVADDHSVVAMDLSPSTSPIRKSFIHENQLLDIFKKTDQANLFVPIQNTPFQQSLVAQTKRPLSPENAAQNQHASKRLGINEYRKRNIADPRRRSTSPLTTPSSPVINSHQTASPYSANGNYTNSRQNNLVTLYPPSQYQWQSNLLPVQTLTQYPMQNYTSLVNSNHTQYPLHSVAPTCGIYSSSRHQWQILPHEERTAEFFAQQFASGNNVHSHVPISNNLSHLNKNFERKIPQTRFASLPHDQSSLPNLRQPTPPLPSSLPPLPSTQPPNQPPLPSSQPPKQPPQPNIQRPMQSSQATTRQTRSPLLSARSSLPSTQLAMQPLLSNTYQTRPHLPTPQQFAPGLTNLVQPVRQVAVASVVRTSTIHAQPYSEQQPRHIVSSVPASLRDSVGQRLIPSGILHLIIMDWDVITMHSLYQKSEFPKSLATEFNQVRNSYTDLLDYYNTYFPLMLVEFWNKLFATYNANQRKEFFFCVSECEVSHTQVDEDTSAETFLMTCNTVVRNCDVDLIPKVMQVCVITCLSGRFLGYVRDARRRDYSVFHDKSNPTLERNSLSANDGVRKSKMRLIVEFACDPNPLKPKDVFSCSKLASMSSLLKQNEALIGLELSPLMRVLFNPFTDQWIELIRLPLSKGVGEMSVALSALTHRVRHRDHHVTLVGFSESYERADQLKALIHIVQRLRHGIGKRLLVCCREEKVEEAAEKIHVLGFDTVVLDRESRSLGHPYRSFDKLAKKSSARQVLENCEVMLAATGCCFYGEILAGASGAPFDTCIIFDAHLLTEPESLVPLSYPVRHVVLIGVPGKLAKTSCMTAHWEFGKSLYQRAYDTSG